MQPYAYKTLYGARGLNPNVSSLSSLFTTHHSVIMSLETGRYYIQNHKYSMVSVLNSNVPSMTVNAENLVEGKSNQKVFQRYDLLCVSLSPNPRQRPIFIRYLYGINILNSSQFLVACHSFGKWQVQRHESGTESLRYHGEGWSRVGP